MRVTAEAKRKTRERILQAARNLFQRKGFEQTTTRDLAAEAGIAVGTLFNYFPTKEDLAMTIIAQAAVPTRADLERRLRGDESLDEALFAHIAAGLRRLLPHRRYLGDVLESTLSPFARSNVATEGDRFRADHLETVRDLIVSHRGESAAEPSLVSMHLYWTLYLGVLSFWTRDASTSQEETLVFLDRATRLFAESLTSDPESLEVSHDS